MLEAFTEAKWQIFVLVAAFALGWIFQKQRPSVHAFLAIPCYGLSIAFFNAFVLIDPSATVANLDPLAFAYKVFNAGINGALVAYFAAFIYFIFYPMDPDDLPAKCLWGSVFIAEAWGLIFNNIGCNLILETAPATEVAKTWGQEASKYVCGREIGEWFEWTPLVAELIYMSIIVNAWTVACQRFKGLLRHL